jgi:hypothetical protein
VNPNTSLLTALYVLQSLLESSVSRKTNQKVLMLGWLSVGTIPCLSTPDAFDDIRPLASRSSPSLLCIYINTARSLEERMDETNCAADTPFPFALPNKHDHRTVYYTYCLPSPHTT